MSNRPADWLEKLRNFLRETVTDIRCMSGMSAQFLQSTKWEIFAAFAQFFGGMSPEVTAWSNSPADLLEALLMCLRAT